MKNPSFSYHRPETLDQALDLLAEIGEDAKIMSGGQSLLPIMAIRLSQPQSIIDISRIEGLASIETKYGRSTNEDTNSGSVTIGAMVTHSQAERSELIANRVPLMHKALPHIGHRAIRNRGTVCGSLAHADPAAELPAVALALGGEIIVASNQGPRSILAKDFFTGFLSTSMEEDEMVIAARFEDFPKNAAASVQELSRRHGDFALVGLACAFALAEDGTIQDIALSFLGVASTPIRAVNAEQMLVGSAPSKDLFEEAAELARSELDPPNDNHASAAYRRHGAGVLTKRALVDCTNQMGVMR